MYARYIPPSKGDRKPPKEPTPEPAAEPTASVVDFSYARWIPPQVSTAAHKAASTPIAPITTTTAEPKKKRKHESDEVSSEPSARKSKKSRSAEEVENSRANKEVTPEGEEEAPGDRSHGKKKRRRKKKGKDELEEASVPEGTATGQVEASEQALESPPEEDEAAVEIPKKAKKATKDKKRKASSDDSMPLDEEEAVSGASVENDATTEVPKKAKKTKKDKRSKEPAEEPIMPPEDEEPISATPEVQPAEDEKPKKETRKKEKKKKPATDADTDLQSSAARDPRYASILAKKAKSLEQARGLSTADTAQPDGHSPDDDDAAEPLEVHGLEPLPQPAPIEISDSKVAYQTLPSWLADPIRVAPSQRRQFEELGIDEKVANKLQAKGFEDAFAVQTAALPLLISPSKRRQSDVLIAAATGSGKTLAYALPIVSDLSRGVVTQLRAIIVLPTRELIKQAQEVFELCASAFDGPNKKRVRIGVAVGSQQLKHEQDSFVDAEDIYDPAGYEKIQEERRSTPSWELALTATKNDPKAGKWPNFVTRYKSKIDVLICTPGRLVDHIKSTRGFSLDFVKWLVVDEADKLLSQTYQDWLPTVMDEIGDRSESNYECLLYKLPDVRKVILSATLTRDLDLLSGLRLWRPKLIVLEGEHSENGVRQTEHVLPELLEEAVVRVVDDDLKPLYLLELLQSNHMAPSSAVNGLEKLNGTDSTAASSTSSESSSSESESEPEQTSTKLDASSLFKTKALIFTKSNEAALRLSRLLELLSRSLGSLTGTLTSTAPSRQRRKTMHDFAAGKLRILIASDLVARGIDLPFLDHVINYDLPASLEGYVHRVGRTARAGRAGKAWTLLPDPESGWFWGKIGKGAAVSRSGKMERVRLGNSEREPFDERLVRSYEGALAAMGEEVSKMRHRRT